MAHPFGDRISFAASGPEEIFASDTVALSAAAEATIRQASESLMVPGTGTVLDLREGLRGGLSRRERRLLEKIETLAIRLELQEEFVSAEPSYLQGYRSVTAKSYLVSDKAISGTNATARTLAGRIVQLRREAGPILPSAIRLGAHSVCAVVVIGIEIAIFHSGLEFAFAPVAGAPDPVISNSLLMLVCLTAIIAGLWAFQNAGERTQGLIRKISRIAIGCFLVGSAAFVGNAIFRSLYDATTSAAFDASDTGGLGLLGSVGLALVYGSAGLLAWVASHHSLGRVRQLFSKLAQALGLRMQATRMERDRFADHAELVSLRHDLECVRDDLSQIDLVTARRVASLCADAAAAGHALLMQLDLSGTRNLNLVPDALTEEALSYDRDVLRAMVKRFEAGIEPCVIRARIHAALSPAKRKSK